MVGDAILITDERGRRFIAKLGDEMIEIAGLGTIRPELLKSSLETGRLVIGGKSLSTRRASVSDIISLIERKAQILTSKDIAMIIHLCDIRCGSKVVEGGAGSGALTIALLASVASAGNVTTYELRDDFAAITSRNVNLAGLSDRWSLKKADICSGIDERDINAVIVDIPNPWDCVQSASDALDVGGSFCAFVPNVNQVERTVHALRDRGFAEIRAFETLLREMVVHNRGIRPSSDMLGHTGYVIVSMSKP